VLSRFFHPWERQLAAITKDRVVRPFDWGLDWISAVPNGSAGSVLGRWVDDVMRDTGGFFEAPPAPSTTSTRAPANFAFQAR
jgi:hypothetical protein